ncbi:multiple monosaccharide ABC transporter substrate-binding protein [Alkalicoccobacillus murimartini]|uniref:Multiple sugar transport system substrate-binding protein n=1 Tax=Alkalicoccobacillus murimartini TaxID=171685 RepID=A0ABT9YG89_9BACI|nr:multiple monosaccharide ABC transporter substrate-binding protein [Alkalicoccobacillus murimartini]MDQ0206875.1 putative multiple sugar transport system substrate-binding protein [Alkalicoccobacillus murimartini]
MKKLGLLGMAMITGVVLVACSEGSSGGEGGEETTVGISMPTQSSERWIADGDNMVSYFEDLGYKAELQYAEDVVENQISQIENMITVGVDALVIAAVDGEALTSVLESANAEGIPVISYDRLIMNSEHVDYYATFDNFEVGVLQGQYIIDQLDLENEEGPFNIELFAGSPDDNNAHFFFNGAMSVLQPYLDEGKLVVGSGQTDFNQISILRWDGATAQSRMDNLLSSNYGGGEELDAVLAPADLLSIGVLASLKSVGYTAEDMPIITGQDADVPSVNAIVAGEQAMTVFKDTRVLAEKAVEMTESVLNDEEPEVNDTETYDNNVKVVPSFLETPVVVDVDNYEELLIDSGYYTEDQLN